MRARLDRLIKTIAPNLTCTDSSNQPSVSFEPASHSFHSRKVSCSSAFRRLKTGCSTASASEHITAAVQADQRYQGGPTIAPEAAIA